ncbi:alpha/beta fold hydrolase [Paeniglutamicibacter cryotolerans]|uniref:Pimeloyl-ACP methyl ester carboxylesterase n=1 Tax=Paeniglutamicibacter cryotolerans TaxID=670079 RepID=A0A839QKQ6_9MICC|nr:alpha/beta fold hydrolase [Paeniglutamicibacter cryotolerans]MBB2996437.1 pimeloyl-ACP methyl ester carboxylesterase [Paeniglutamicibacter cryotolerans]
MGSAHEHLVEGTANALSLTTHEPEAPAALRPVVLLHGFASSSYLNWEKTGWIRVLAKAGRRVLAVDLPGHGSSPAPDDLDAYTPSRIRADLLQLLMDHGALALNPANQLSGVDLIGYSLGARLAWEFGGTQDQLVHRLVLGGAASTDPLAAFDLAAAQRFLADGTPIADAETANLLRMARTVETNDMFSLMSMIEAIKTEPFAPGQLIPTMPTLLVAGDGDPLAASMPRLTELLATRRTPSSELWITGRDHANAVTSREFKDAAVDFLAT